MPSARPVWGARANCAEASYASILPMPGCAGTRFGYLVCNRPYMTGTGHPGTPTSVEELIEQAVARSIERLLEPYLVRLSKPEPLVYTVAQAAVVLQVSTDTIGRLVKRGIL